jgi:predicted acetyltransferase
MSNVRGSDVPQPKHVEVRAAEAHERLALSRMLELYQHDLSDIWDQELDAEGQYGYELDRYWTDQDCRPFVALVDGHYAGFALVDRAVKVMSDGYWMDQFFIVKRYRRLGVGSTLAAQVLQALPGRWEVGQMPENIAAQAFWRRVIGLFTGGRYTEHQLVSGCWRGMVQCFESAT